MIIKRHVVLDVEANALIRPSKIWCIVLKDIDTQEVFKFRPKTPTSGHIDFIEDFVKFCLEEVSLYIGHNIIGYDAPNLNRIIEEVLGIKEFIKVSQCLDTLVLSRLFRPTPPFKFVRDQYNREYGHSLEAWGNYLGFPKISFSEFDKFSEPMLEYCERDVLICFLTYKELWFKERNYGDEGFSDECIELEHQVAHLLHLQEYNGFYLNREKADHLLNITTDKLQEMDTKLQQLFPPEFKFVKNLELKKTKNGEIAKVPLRILNAYQTNENCKAVLKEDGSYDLFVKEVFNPESGKQIGGRLLSLGWKPRKFTDKGNIKTDQETLQEELQLLISERPELESLRCLSDYSIVSDRKQKVEKWIKLANLPEWNDGRIHGKVNPLGAATARCSHYDDNMANVASVVVGKDKKPIYGLQGGYGWESRDCWSVPSNDMCLVGADASGIQLRALANYMNDAEYIRQLLEGDIHEVNRIAAGIDTRPTAKTFIYAWLLGAGDEKVGTIVGVKESEYEDLFKFARDRRHWKGSLLEYFITSLREKGRKADKRTVATIIKGYKTKEQFLNRTPALKRLRKEDIPAATKRGYLVGLDGRKLWIPNEHLAMSLYLQGFEAVIMKKAMVIYQAELESKNIPFKQVAFVHDEFQIETYWEYADTVGKAVVYGIKKAGELYNSNCPLDGEYKIGKTWAETH